MSFRFEWPEFGPEFHAHAAGMLNSALNKGPRPKVIADDIRVKELNMGTIPPELDILEIGDLTTDRFRGIFRLTYHGDAHLILSTKVQANPLSRPPAKPELSIFRSNTTSNAASASRGILFAASPLIVPMHLRLSHVRLRAIVVLVVSKSKGVTLVFKNDPLESVDVSSTFDGVAVIQKYLQQEIEGQLREMFREDLPGIIHRLSQSWLARSRDAAATATASNPNSASAASAPVAGVHPPRPSAATAATSASATDGAKHQYAHSTTAYQSPAAPAASQAKKAHSAVPPPPPGSGLAVPTPPRPRTRKRSQGTPNVSASASRTAVGVLSSSPSTLPPQSPLRHNSFGFGAAGPAARNSVSPSRRRSSASGRPVPSAPGQATQTQRRPTLDRSKSTSAAVARTTTAASFVLPDADEQSSQTLRDIEEYDPTYGLRPDEVDLDRSLFKSGFSGLGRLLQNGHDGLGGLHTLADEDEDVPSEIESELEDEDEDEVGDWTGDGDAVYDSLDDGLHMDGSFPHQNGRREAAYPPHLSPPDSLDNSAEEDEGLQAAEQEADDDDDDDIDPFVSSAFGSEAASNTFGYFSLDFASQSRTIFDKKTRPSSAAVTPDGGAGGTIRQRRVSATSAHWSRVEGAAARGINEDASASGRKSLRTPQSKSSALPTRNPIPTHRNNVDYNSFNGHVLPSPDTRREEQYDYRGFPAPARYQDGFSSPSALSDRISSPSRMSVARSLSGVGMGISSGLGVAVGLGSAGSYNNNNNSSGGRSTPGIHQHLASAAAASVSSPSIAGSMRSRGSGPGAANGRSPSSSSSLAPRPRIYHVASRVQVPVLDEEGEARHHHGYVGNNGSAVASSSFGGQSSATRSSRTRGAQQQLGPLSQGGGSRGAGTVRASNKSTRTGGAGTTGTRTIRAPPSMGSSKGLDMPRWGESNGVDAEEEEGDQHATLRARPGASAATKMSSAQRGAMPVFDQQLAWQGQEQSAWRYHDDVDDLTRNRGVDRAAYWNGGISDDYDEDDDLGRVSDLDDEDDEDEEDDDVDELGGAYRSRRNNHQLNGSNSNSQLDEGSTLSPSGSRSGTGSSILSGTNGTGGSSSEQNSLTTLEPTPMDPRSSEFKRQLYREQYQVQTDDVSDDDFGRGRSPAGARG
ncbi:hypothetical protein A4X13_0g5496 [Tilletia indica]|uniref:Mitochondrial distribution and morphology protein 34 n=1 Tax=Tilletia indica TaxID=43049 RepID=A0A177TNK1_9BASI|nr:hypothetical protein A4X13_0g5496 [Tilletia indica]